MEQVPNMISTKDLSYLCDIFNSSFKNPNVPKTEETLMLQYSN